MNLPHLRTIDLNLLRVFVALLDEGNVTRAGARLGLTQSAVSHALNRLRYAIGDPLFVRGPSGMLPTPRATEIAPRIRAGLAQVQAALAPAGFTPAETDRRFVIAASAYTASVLIPHVAARIQSEAPYVSLRVRTPDAPVGEELDTGRCDIALGGFGRVPDRFASETVFSDRLVWVLRHDHPMANQPLTVERLAELHHVLISTSDATDLVQGNLVENGIERRVSMDDGVLEQFALRGLVRRVGLTVEDLHSALAIVASSDMVAPAPYGLFKLFGPALGLREMEPPYPSAGGRLHALWRKDSDGPALHWLRGLLREAGAHFMETRDDR